jgi:hypothetical protein
VDDPAGTGATFGMNEMSADIEQAFKHNVKLPTIGKLRFIESQKKPRLFKSSLL